MNENKQVLVTGETGGLGFEVAKMLLEQKINILGLSRGSKKENIDILTSIAKENNSHFNHLSLDLSTLTSKDDLKKYLTEFPDHVVICHGKNFNAPVDELGVDTILQSMKINYFGPFLLSQYCYSHWKKQKDGKDHSIIYISSVASKGGSPDEIAYHSTKRAMEAAMLSFAREGASYGIRANVVSPGLMDTQMGKETLKNRPDVLKRIPLGKLTKVQDVTEGVSYLIRAETITGQNLHINAGRYMSI